MSPSTERNHARQPKGRKRAAIAVVGMAACLAAAGIVGLTTAQTPDDPPLQVSAAQRAGLLPEDSADSAEISAPESTDLPPALGGGQGAPTAAPPSPGTQEAVPPPTVPSPEVPPAPTSDAPASTGSATPPPAAPGPPAPPAPPTPGIPAEAQQVVDLVNQERASAGCGALAVDSRLTSAAQGHASDMAERDYFSHESPEGTTFVDRANAAGYPSPGGENIAKGQTSAAQVMDDWMNSSSHRANILNCDFTTIGVGVDENDWTWVQVFGY